MISGSDGAPGAPAVSSPGAPAVSSPGDTAGSTGSAHAEAGALVAAVTTPHLVKGTSG